MLRSFGFDAAVLEGGFEKWRAKGRPTESGKPKGYPPATFVAAPRPGLFVDKAAVLGAIGQPDTVIVNALGDDLYKGIGPSRYGRPGRIPGSVQVSAATLVDAAGQGFTTLADPSSPSARHRAPRSRRWHAPGGARRGWHPPLNGRGSAA